MLTSFVSAVCVCAVLMCTAGCDDQPERAVETTGTVDAVVMTTDAGGESDATVELDSPDTSSLVATPLGDGLVQLDLPMVAKAGEQLSLTMTPADLVESTPTLRRFSVRSPILLLSGHGLPTTFTVGFKSPYFAFGSCSQTEGRVAWTDLTAVGLTVVRTNEYEFMLENIAPGEGLITARGVFYPAAADYAGCEQVFDAQTEVVFDFEFDVKVTVPVDVRAPREPDCTVLLSDSPVGSVFSLAFVDADGAVVGGQNVDSAYPVALTVTAPEGISLDQAEKGYQGLTLGPGSGVLEFVAPFGEPVRYVIEDGSGITDWSIAWSIAGTAGGGVFDLENGGSYGPPWGRTSNRLMPGLTAPLVRNGAALCELNVSPSWFTLVSETPENCVVDEEIVWSNQIAGASLGHSVSLMADGACRARLDAPRFKGGQGVSKTIEITVTDVEGMIDL